MGEKMQKKWPTLLITIAIGIALSMSLIVTTYAVGEEGAGTLYVYTDPERTTLAHTDTEGRYITVPGVEYYFNVSGITEYSIGTSITIWVYRTNTSENIEVGKFEVNSVPFNANFNWTIPDDWTDEVAKIKYGTNLENDWLFAKNDIWVNSRIGTGTLYAYTDTARTKEATLDSGQNYLVYPGAQSTKTTYYVWAHYQGLDVLICSFHGAKEKYSIIFDWTIPSNLPIGTSIHFKYGLNPKTGPSDNWVYARRMTISAPRLLMVVPEVFLGSLGVSSALFSGLGIIAPITGAINKMDIQNIHESTKEITIYPIIKSILKLETKILNTL
jgi:hypothetical protein